MASTHAIHLHPCLYFAVEPCKGNERDIATHLSITDLIFSDLRAPINGYTATHNAYTYLPPLTFQRHDGLYFLFRCKYGPETVPIPDTAWAFKITSLSVMPTVMYGALLTNEKHPSPSIKPASQAIFSLLQFLAASQYLSFRFSNLLFALITLIASSAAWSSQGLSPLGRSVR